MEKIDFNRFLGYLPKRPKDSHKGLFGHVLVIGGNQGFSGAVRLSAEAALRVGAGLVSIATHPTHAAMLNIGRPELMVNAIEGLDQLEALLQRATVIVLGPGLGQDSWAKSLFERVIHSEKFLILDADGLNCLAEKPFKLNKAIVTPHPLEAARLLKKTVAEIQANRIDAVRELSTLLGSIVVLKGFGTLINDWDGNIFQCTEGNPGMSSAGMGDVLSGVIAGLVAQSVSFDKAAILGVSLHAKAGDCAAKEGERGLLASDLFTHLRRLVNL